MARYLVIDELLNQVERGPREQLRAIYNVHKDLFSKTPGSRAYHQLWAGGYLDHVTEVMNIARQLYPALHSLRSLPNFTLSDSLIVLFLHDIEKPFRPDPLPDDYNKDGHKLAVLEALYPDLKTLWSADGDSLSFIWQAIFYVEGEKDYRFDGPRMSPLAAFCHCCDMISARIWPTHPLDDSGGLPTQQWGWRHNDESRTT